MPENEEKYVAYMEYHSSISNNYALFSGFTFASITVLLTQLPDPSQPFAQAILFTLMVMLAHFLYSLFAQECTLSNCVRVAPQLPEKWLRRKRTEGWEHVIGWITLGLSVTFMFLLWGLLYLALASLIAYALFIIRAHFNLEKPLAEAFRERPWVRK